MGVAILLLFLGIGVALFYGFAVETEQTTAVQSWQGALSAVSTWAVRAGCANPVLTLC